MQLELDQLDLRYEELRIANSLQQAHLVSSLLSDGQLSPVVVVAGEEPERYVLIDGYARVAALRQLAQDMVEATVLPVSEAEALMQCHGLRSFRRRSAIEEGWLIRELVERHGLERREVSTRLGRSASWVCRRLALVEVLPDAVQTAVRRSRVPPHAAQKFLVPLARANAEQCVGLVEKLGEEPVSTRQVERLYVGWRRGDDETRARIVEQPRLFLRASETVEEDAASAATPGTPLLNDLEALAGVAHRARRRIRDGVLEEVDETTRRAIHRAFGTARQAFATLSDLLEPEAVHVGPRHASRDLQAA